MGQRRKRHSRCPACFLHVELCICADLPAIAVGVRVVIVMHRSEVHKPSNTGRLAVLTLSDARLEVRGRTGEALDLRPHAPPERRPLLLFPREDAVLLDAELLAADPRPVTLFVPDGTWAQARRAVKRDETLLNAQAVRLPEGPPSRYQLRKEHLPHGLATAEGLARALRIIEGDAAADALEAVFHLFVEQTLASRSS